MGLPEEGQHVMLTKRKEIDILYNHHLLVVLFLEHGATKHGCRIFMISFGQELHGFGYTFGRFQQTFAVYIFTKQIDNEISYLKLDTKVRREFMLMEARLLDERREGEAVGIAKGEAKEKLATAKRLFRMGLSVQDIAKATSLPIEQVEALQAEQSCK